jgi:UDP-N-acetylglucosamine 4,6-dehydratase
MGRRMEIKILITGGAGTVGKAFINEYYNDYKFYSISRNETHIAKLKQEFPNVKCYIGDICDLDHMINIFSEVQPDIVIHAAALKHINLAEENPTKAVEINVVGTLNIIKASVRAEVPLTVGISTDKACNPDSTYGYSKKMMESMFMQYHNNKTKFVCTRFANVANSNGSVIPFWLSEAAKGNALKLTDPGMNRLMFSKQESAELIKYAIDASDYNFPFVVCQKMKNVNLLELAKIISDKEVEIIGKRPGEKLNETLISKKELPFTMQENGYILIVPEAGDEGTLTEEHSSSNAEWMTQSEMLTLIQENK